MKRFLAVVILAASAFAQQNVAVYQQKGGSQGGRRITASGLGTTKSRSVSKLDTSASRLKPNTGNTRLTQTARGARARAQPGRRSTWKIEVPKNVAAARGIASCGCSSRKGRQHPVDSPGGVRFTDPNFAMTLVWKISISVHRAFTIPTIAARRGRSFKIPNFGQKGIAARTDYIVNGPSDCSVFLTAAKSNGKEGRVIHVRTQDGGKNWKFVSFVTPSPKQRPRDHASNRETLADRPAVRGSLSRVH